MTIRSSLAGLLPLAAVLLAPGPARADGVAFNLYGDFDYIGYRTVIKDQPGVATPPTTYSSTFTVPRVTTLATGDLGRLSLVSETVFGLPLLETSFGNAFHIDVERFEIGYQVADWLRLKAGVFHTGFGYYNDAYHTGYYYQLAIDRPGFTKFENDGGLIPAHSIGVHADGRLRLGAAGALRYDVEVANSRGGRIDLLAYRQDPSKSKAVNLRLRWEPRFLEGLVVGVNYAFGHIAGSTQVVGVDAQGQPVSLTIPGMHEQILGAHAAYVERDLHLIAEVARFIHTADGTDQQWTTDAGYLEAGYSFGPLTPYLLVDRVALPTQAGFVTDPYFALSVAGFVGSRWLYAGGIKWQVVDGLALKLELDRVDLQTSTTHAIISQAAVAF